MRLYRPAIRFLREAVHPGIIAARSELLKMSAAPASVQRVHLAYTGTQPCRTTVLVKHILKSGQEDLYDAVRELRFYRELAPRLDIPLPQVYYAGPEPAGDGYLLVLEDLEVSYRFHEPSYVWSREELFRLLRAYARLHVAGTRVLPPLAERGWLMTYLQEIKPAQKLPWMAAELTRLGFWPPLTGIERLVEEAQAAYQGWDQHPVTVLHNDVYPPNVGLPLDPLGEVILVDWEMAGWGFAEFDLAYLFIQPFGSARCLTRQEALAFYWGQRQKLEGIFPGQAERELVQRQAEILLCLALTVVAYQAALNPYPMGTAPAIYWQAMYKVLAGEIRRLGLSEQDR